MEKIANRSFIGESITIDGKAFVGCEFDDCTFIFRGEALFAFSECKTERSRMQLEGPAALTLSALRQILHSGGPHAEFAAAMIRNLSAPLAIKGN